MTGNFNKWLAISTNDWHFSKNDWHFQKMTGILKKWLAFFKKWLAFFKTWLAFFKKWLAFFKKGLAVFKKWLAFSKNGWHFSKNGWHSSIYDQLLSSRIFTWPAAGAFVSKTSDFLVSEAQKSHMFCNNRDFGGFWPSNHGESIGLAESYSKMGINFSGDE